MKSKVLKRYSVYENIITCLDKHLSAWQHVKEMSKTHDRFVRNFKKLSDHKVVLDQDLKSLTDRHVRIHQDLVDRIRPLLGVLSVYAAENGNKTLGKQVDVRAKQLGELKDPRLLELSEAVISLDSDVKKGKSGALNAADYGLTVEMTDDIRTKSEELRSSRAAIKSAKKERKRSTEAAGKLIKRNDKLLKSGTDKFIKLFRESEVALYNDYRQARRAESPRK
jgi:hypothetical protein